MVEVLKSKTFRKWEAKLKDKRARALVSLRIARLAYGHLGDVKPVGGGIGELRIHYGAGLRLYYTKRGREIILLLCGGDKSTQQRDIEKALVIAKQWSGKNE